MAVGRRRWQQRQHKEGEVMQQEQPEQQEQEQEEQEKDLDIYQQQCVSHRQRHTYLSGSFPLSRRVEILNGANTGLRLFITCTSQGHRQHSSHPLP